MLVTVFVQAALICFNQACYPALVGKDARPTPTGVYDVKWVETDQRGYGGSVLVFKEEPKVNLAIHRVWTLIPTERRVERLEGDSAKARHISNGCINVSGGVYDALWNAPSIVLVIRP